MLEDWYISNKLEGSESQKSSKSFKCCNVNMKKKALRNSWFSFLYALNTTINLFFLVTF